MGHPLPRVVGVEVDSDLLHGTHDDGVLPGTTLDLEGVPMQVHGWNIIEWFQDTSRTRSPWCTSRAAESG